MTGGRRRSTVAGIQVGGYYARIGKQLGGGYLAEFPDLPGCITEGDTLEEALVNAREAVVGHLAALRQIGEPVPEEDDAPRLVAIEVAEEAVA